MSRSLDALVRALPKAELHVHLEGSTPAWLAGRWAQREGVSIPGLTQDTRGQWRYDFRGFEAFLDCYIALSRCIMTEEDIVDLARGVAQELHQQQVRYVELTFTPTTHLARAWNQEDLIAALSGAVQVAREVGVRVAWVFDFVRCYPETADPTIDVALAAREAGLPVVGFGVGGPEGDTWPSATFAAAFARAREAGLASVPHAGENRGAQGVREAIEELGAARIGHGIRCIEDPQVVALLESSQICLEICPTSNLELLGIPSLQAHPLASLQHRQVQWTLASDDPPLVGTTLNEEYLRCAQAYGWDASMVRRIAETSFRCSMLPPGEVDAYLDQIASAFRDWQAPESDPR